MFLRQFRQLNLFNNKLLINQQCATFASKFQRNNVIDTQSGHDLETKEILKENRRLSKDEWEKLRTEILHSSRFITAVNIDATLIKCCLPAGKLDVGKSYMEYLKQSGIEPNLATRANFLRLYFYASKCGVEITNEDLRDISELHKYLLNKYTELDPHTCESLILALMLTEDWRKSLDLIEMIKIISKPSTTAYCVIVSQAFRVGDGDLGWKLLREMSAHKKIPNCGAFLSYISYCRDNPKTFVENIQKILEFIGTNEIVISSEVANELRDALNDFGNTNCVTSIPRGKCMSCNKHLRDVALTDAEFQQLSEKMLNNVLIGKDIFLKSTPDEVTNFVKFVDRTKPYDFVIDGLNVSYGKGGDRSRKAVSKLIASVVTYFVNRKKKVLVVGRRHMESWPAVHINYIRKNSHLFLADDLSQDDPFFLYAALKSGPNTDVISRDLMRGHAFLLDDKLKSLFRRWQRQHQFALDPNGSRIHTFGPLKFITNAHQVDGYWHIPFSNDVTALASDSFVPANWLCVKINCF